MLGRKKKQSIVIDGKQPKYNVGQTVYYFDRYTWEEDCKKYLVIQAKVININYMNDKFYYGVTGYVGREQPEDIFYDSLDAMLDQLKKIIKIGGKK